MGGIGRCQMYFVNEYLIEKSNETLTTHIIKKKKAFLLHHILECLKELWDEYGAEPIFIHTISAKR